MPVIQIDYDLQAPDKNYDAVIDKIKTFPGWCPVLQSCWLVAGQALTVDNVFTALRGVMDSNDLLLVTNFRLPYQGWLRKTAHEWIGQHAT